MKLVANSRARISTTWWLQKGSRTKDKRPPSPGAHRPTLQPIESGPPLKKTWVGLLVDKVPTTPTTYILAAVTMGVTKAWSSLGDVCLK